MKIYFAGSIRGGREDQDIYFSIIKILGEFGTVLTEHIGDVALSGMGEVTRTNQEIFERDMSWVEESDMIVADVSRPSLGVGYEIGRAEAMGKPVLCLYREQPDKRLSAMIDGNEKLTVARYESVEDVYVIIENFIKK